MSTKKTWVMAGLIIGAIVVALQSSWLGQVLATGVGAGAFALLYPSLCVWGSGPSVFWLFRPSVFLPLGLIFVTCGLFFPLLGGNMPQSADHPVHLTRAWHFWTQNLMEGSLSGWSDFWFGGWPSGEDYPPLGDYWYALCYGLTGGILGWEGTYALSFLSMMTLVVLCLYGFGNAYWNPWVGFLIGLFFILDKGAYREGGWTYTVTWGVWPQVLSTGLCFAAFALFVGLVKNPSSRRFALSALFVGLALLAHPMGLVVFLMGVPIWLFLFFLDSEHDERSRLLLVPVACALGLGLAAFWIVPFASKGEWMAKYGELWLSLSEMGRRIWAGTLFSGTTPVLIWAALAGGALSIRQRHFGGLFCVLFAGLLMLISSRTVFHEMDLLSVSSSFGQIQFQRFVIPAKPLVFALAGYLFWALPSVWKKTARSSNGTDLRGG